ncbi:PREDICTED: calbindin-32-like [Priapulus caudatus]|uniref:Calbindin-32-like n=1 Tax=Priapulus caudatus TaxID=37621 RepID=A0ABM1FC35_PRICU|nr:PREDICTED: calbindin-32-like [Priapulus caudatus]
MGLESKMIDKAISAAMLAELKQCFMEAYDDNKDGRIEIYELAQLLPMEENFLLLFRVDNPLESSVEFMRLWKKYDKDHSGFIEADELRQFLKDLLGESHKEVSEEKLVEYTSIMVSYIGVGKSGYSRTLLPVKENFLSRQVFKGPTNLSKDDIQRVFSMYDRDNNGVIEEEEIHGFLKDLLEMAKEDYDTGDLAQFKDVIMQADINHDGKISRSELTMVLMALAKRGAEEAAAGKPPQPAASS